MANRLIHETSPYLRLHAENPVDWYPWGEEAINRSRSENKPILLSIGYTACHWCHVMERESFQDEAVAVLMNDNFVNIKVDREERPDLDQIYMQAVQSFTGQGGWPMTVFLTPDLKPFYGGTYFPPRPLGNMPSFSAVLISLSDAYRSQFANVSKIAEDMLVRLNQGIRVSATPGSLDLDLLERTFGLLSEEFDQIDGGFNSGPKFPQPMTSEYLIRCMGRVGDKRSLDMVRLTLDSMGNRGIYDHIGGGFHRYATDKAWEIPHFEKMLYDNALLARLYLHGFLSTGNLRYRDVALETIDYVLRDLVHPTGGFFTSEDADSEGSEGRFYLWTRGEIEDAVGLNDSKFVCEYYGITDPGEFEGSNIMRISQSLDAIAGAHGIELKELVKILSTAKERLRITRNNRDRPDRDEKILTSWNGLMIGTLAEAAMVLDRGDYLKSASDNAEFILGNLRNEGRLLRTYRDGQSKLYGYLEDYSFLADGLITLYEASFEYKWLEEAVVVVDEMIRLFWDDGNDRFFDTGSDHEELIVRPCNLFDNAIPSGNSAAALALLRLSILTGNLAYREYARLMLQGMSSLIRNYPLAFSHWLCALDFYLSSPKELALIGDPNTPEMRELVKVIHHGYLPNKVIVGMRDCSNGKESDLPLLQGRKMIDGRPTVYLCENYVCKVPTTDPDDLTKMLYGD